MSDRTIAFTHRSLLITHHLTDVFDGATQHGAFAPLDDGTLNQVWVLRHERDNLVVGKLFLSQFQFAVDGFALAQDVAGREIHLRQEFAQLRLAQRLCVVIDFLKRDAALTEQPANLAALASSRLFVNYDFIVHHSAPSKKPSAACSPLFAI